MPFSYNVAGVVACIRKAILTSLTAQGEAPAMVPATFSVEQYQFSTLPLPITMIEIGHTSISHEEGPVSALLTLNGSIHHIRTRDETGDAEIIALTRLGGIGAELESDYKLYNSGGAAIPIREIMMTALMVGGTERVMMGLENSYQNVSMAIVSMPFIVTWNEGP